MHHNLNTGIIHNLTHIMFKDSIFFEILNREFGLARSLTDISIKQK